MSGWGLTSLSMHAETGEGRYLDYAVMAGERLLQLAIPEGEGRYWRSPRDGVAYLGYAHGTCGIARFLLRLHVVTADHRFRLAATEAIEFTLRNAYKNGSALQWFPHAGTRIVYPYWRHGTAGVGVALLRFYEELQDERYLLAARKAASGLRMLFAAIPGQFDGMSGVGEFLLDMYNATDERRY